MEANIRVQHRLSFMLHAMRVWLSSYAVLLVCVTACAERKPPSVWETYDVRHPVPAGSRVPDSYARQYDYIDNDSYYSAPNCAGGFDSPACVGGGD